MKQPGQQIVCAQDLAGSWFKVVDQLSELSRVCNGINQPLSPPVPLNGAIAPMHAPSALALGGSLVVTWADKADAVPDGKWRVHYRVAKRFAGAWIWSPPKPWMTKGDLTGEDLPATTNRAHSLALLPGAGGWSAIPEDNLDRISVQYEPVSYPDLACGAQERYFAFASARLGDSGLDLTDFSMGVAQNESVDVCLTPLQSTYADFLTDHGAAGAVHRSAGRTYAWIRKPSAGTEPKQPSYGLYPIDDYGPLLVKSTAWR
ncbi:MAG: hypothetical protein HY902_02070 [Deltaproteobacteria bacterium]|nr:hypothetical protein [Deltaproteobacteria bacterium]